MITTNEYLREKARADAAEARVAELENELRQLKRAMVNVPSEPSRQDTPE